MYRILVHHCGDWHTSCWNAVAFNDSVTMLLPDTSCSNDFIQCVIRAVVELSSFFCVFRNLLCLLKTKKYFPSLVGRCSTGPINTSPQNNGKDVMLAVTLFFCPIHAFFLSTTLSNSLPYVTHKREVKRSSFPTAVRSFALIARNCMSHVCSEFSWSFLPSRLLASNWCPRNLPNTV